MLTSAYSEKPQTRWLKFGLRFESRKFQKRHRNANLSFTPCYSADCSLSWTNCRGCRFSPVNYQLHQCSILISYHAYHAYHLGAGTI